jgi:hypothetical protein
MLFPFVESLIQNFSFNPTLDGNNYVAVITWNVAGQRYYLNLTDVSGNLIICDAIVSSADPQAIASLDWESGVVTVTTVNPHWIPLGQLVSLRINLSSPAGYNGVFDCTPTGLSSFTYELDTDPGDQVQVGSFGAVVDLCQGLFETSRLVYYSYNNSFEAFP